MMSDEGDIRQLIKAAEANIQAENHAEAEQQLFEAWAMAEQIRNLALANTITSLCERIGLLLITPQFIELNPLKAQGFILDIGGGGEGIIGRLNGAQAVAIDTSERELRETRNDALKIVMDATDLKFLPNSFDICTAFFSLMYIPESKHSKVFEEVHRVLRDNGQFFLWDVRIPRTDKKYRQVIVPLRIQLPKKTIGTGYGVKWQTQDIAYFKKLAEECKFKIVDEWNKGETLHLKMLKEA